MTRLSQTLKKPKKQCSQGNYFESNNLLSSKTNAAHM
jgi:hypothetical protein